MSSIAEQTAAAYFQAIEETFIRLRGAPLLLSPGDWQLARDWQRRGIPVALVQVTLEEVFAQRALAGKRGRIHGLRYVRGAVEEAWEAARALRGTARVAGSAEPTVDVEARLEALANALPEALPDRQVWGRRLRALAATAGELEAVELALGSLEAELLDHLLACCDEAQRRSIDDRVAQALSRSRVEPAAADLAPLMRRLRWRLLRETWGLERWTLFASTAPDPPVS